MNEESKEVFNQLKLNALSPAIGSKKNRKRVGRGIGSGLGKTAGRGHKGQKSRAGGYHKVGFEGGQNPLYRRLPKFGFNSMTEGDTVEVRLQTIQALGLSEINLMLLKEYHIVSQKAKNVKIIKTGELNIPVKIVGLLVTKGARAVIEAAGGSIIV